MIKKFEEIITLKRGFDLPEHNRIHGIYPLYAASGLSDFVNSFKIHGPGVITGRSGTIGQVFYTEEDFWPLNTTLFVADFHGNNEKYISYWLSTFNLENYSSGASVPTLNRNELNGLECVVHNAFEQQHIVDTLRRKFYGTIN